MAVRKAARLPRAAHAVSPALPSAPLALPAALPAPARSHPPAPRSPSLWLLQGLTSMNGGELADSIMTFTEERPPNPAAFR